MCVCTCLLCMCMSLVSRPGLQAVHCQNLNYLICLILPNIMLTKFPTIYGIMRWIAIVLCRIKYNVILADLQIKFGEYIMFSGLGIQHISYTVSMQLQYRDFAMLCGK